MPHNKTVVGKMEEQKKWLIGIFGSILTISCAIVYHYGGLEGRVNSVEEKSDRAMKRVERVEERIETVYTIFDSRLNTIIIGLGDLKTQGEVNASQLKSVRDDVKLLKTEIALKKGR